MPELLPITYISVENRTRELASKLLVACELVDRGLTVVIGQQWLLNHNLPKLPPGVVLFKGLNRIQTYNMKLSWQYGHLPISNDEEALGVADEGFMTKDVDPEAGRAAHRLLALGDVHRRVLANHCGIPESEIPVVGNPRLDLLRPEFLRVYDDEVAELRAKHGRFVLINTNSAGINSSWGSRKDYYEILVRIGWIDPKNEEDNKLFDEHIEHDRNNLRAIHQLIETLSQKEPDLPIVLRPHPSERCGHYLEHFGNRTNVTVVPESNHLPWMLAAAIVINTGCTTGMEAQIMGRPVLSICPEETRWHGFYLANSVNLQARQTKDAVGAIRMLLRGERDLFAEMRPRLMQTMERYISGIEGGYSFELMAREIASVFSEDAWTKEVPDFHQSDKFDRHFDRHRVLRGKMTVSLDEVRSMMRNLRAIAGKPGDLPMEEIGDSLFLMKPVKQS